MNEVYVVEMLRWGDREQHSYVIGVHNRKHQAEDVGKAEKERRGGKYEYEITPITVNALPEKWSKDKSL
tara:strand:+ start:535 stop:741 length:207 start_codon:yes stop_codon:yes gene_type:complete